MAESQKPSVSNVVKSKNDTTGENEDSDDDEDDSPNIFDDIQEEEKDDWDEGESEEDSGLSIGKENTTNKIVPSELAITIWSSSRQIGPDWGEDDWKSIKVANQIRKYTSHTKAKDFAAHKVDDELPGLFYKEKVQAEKRLELLQVFRPLKLIIHILIITNFRQELEQQLV